MAIETSAPATGPASVTPTSDPPSLTPGHLAREREPRPTRSDLQSDLGSRSRSRVNVGPVERVVSTVVGGYMVSRAIRRPSPVRIVVAAAGGGLVYRGVTGHCPAYGLLGLSTARRYRASAYARPQVIERSVTIQAGAESIERALRQPNTLATMMAHFVDVQPTTGGGARWALRLPLGRKLEWETRAGKPRTDEALRWESVEGAKLPHRGSIRLRPHDLGTEVTLRLSADPPAPAAALASARLARVVPAAAMSVALRRLKSLVEAGEVSTTANTPVARARAGRRGD